MSGIRTRELSISVLSVYTIGHHTDTEPAKASNRYQGVFGRYLGYEGGKLLIVCMKLLMLKHTTDHAGHTHSF